MRSALVERNLEDLDLVPDQRLKKFGQSACDFATLFHSSQLKDAKMSGEGCSRGASFNAGATNLFDQKPTNSKGHVFVWVKP
jgi:hypothetical protein